MDSPAMLVTSTTLPCGATASNGAVDAGHVAARGGLARRVLAALSEGRGLHDP